MDSVLQEIGLGRGIYAVSEVSRLTSVPAARIRRWFRGYDFSYRGETRRSERAVVGEYDDDSGPLQLSFYDMTEMRVIDAFLRFGVSWTEVRRASEVATEMLSTTHPFSSSKFRTDGRRIFAQMDEGSGGPALVELRRHQHVFRSVITPLLKDLEFDGDDLRRWWPMGRRKRVVIDPVRALGRPIGFRSGIPVEVLARFATANSVREASIWYELDPVEIRHAVEFERRLAA